MKTDSKTSRLDTVAFVWRRTKLWARTYQLLADEQPIGNCKRVEKAESFWSGFKTFEFQFPVGLLRVGQTGSVWRKTAAITFTLTDASGNMLFSGDLKSKWFEKHELTVLATGTGEPRLYTYKPTNFWCRHYNWFLADEKMLEANVRPKIFSRTVLALRVLPGPLPAPIAWVLLGISLYIYLSRESNSD